MNALEAAAQRRKAKSSSITASSSNPPQQTTSSKSDTSSKKIASSSNTTTKQTTQPKAATPSSTTSTANSKISAPSSSSSAASSSTSKSKRQSIPGDEKSVIAPPVSKSTVPANRFDDTGSAVDDQDTDDAWKELDAMRISTSSSAAMDDKDDAPIKNKVPMVSSSSSMPKKKNPTANSSSSSALLNPNVVPSTKSSVTNNNNTSRRPSVASNQSRSSFDLDPNKDSNNDNELHQDIDNRDSEAKRNSGNRPSYSHNNEQQQQQQQVRKKRLSIEDMTKISEDRLSYQMSTNPQTLQNLLMTTPQSQSQLQSQPVQHQQQAYAQPTINQPQQPSQQFNFQQQLSFSSSLNSPFQQQLPPPLSPQKSNKQDYFNANSVDKYRSAMDIFNTIQNKPIVRIFFESYCSDENNMIMDGSQLQALNYDLGIYVTMKEVHDIIEKIVQEDIDQEDEIDRESRGDYDYNGNDYASNGSNSNKKKKADDIQFICHYFTYEDFLVYWRNHPFFRTMKLTDPLVKRRVFIASLYREVDILLQGAVKKVQFEKIYEALVDKDYINPKKYKLDDVIKRMDAANKGKIEMNRFISWMDQNVSIPTANNLSTLSRIVHSLIPGNSASRPKSPQTTGVSSGGGGGGIGGNQSNASSTPILQAKSTPATAVIAEKTMKPKDKPKPPPSPVEGGTRNSLDFRFLKSLMGKKPETPAATSNAPSPVQSHSQSPPATRRPSLNRIDPITLTPTNSNLPPRRASLRPSADLQAAAMMATASFMPNDVDDPRHQLPPPPVPQRRASLNVPQHSPFSDGSTSASLGGTQATTVVSGTVRPMRRMSAAPPSMPPPPIDSPSLSSPPLPLSPIPTDIPLPTSPLPPMSPATPPAGDDANAASQPSLIVAGAMLNSQPIPIYSPGPPEDDSQAPTSLSRPSSGADDASNCSMGNVNNTGKRVLKSSLARRKSVMKTSTTSSPSAGSSSLSSGSSSGLSKGFSNTSVASGGLASAALGSAVGLVVTPTGGASGAPSAGTSTGSALSRRFPSLANRAKASSTSEPSNETKDSPPAAKSVNSLLFAAVDDDNKDMSDNAKDNDGNTSSLLSNNLNPLSSGAAKGSLSGNSADSSIISKLPFRELPPRPTTTTTTKDTNEKVPAKGKNALSSLAKLKKTSAASTSVNVITSSASSVISSTSSVDSAGGSIDDDEKEKKFKSKDKEKENEREVITLRTLMDMRSLAAANSLARKEVKHMQEQQLPSMTDSSVASMGIAARSLSNKGIAKTPKTIQPVVKEEEESKVIVESSFTPGTAKAVAVFVPPQASRPSSPLASSSPTSIKDREKKFFRSLAVATLAAQSLASSRNQSPSATSIGTNAGGTRTHSPDGFGDDTLAAITSTTAASESSEEDVEMELHRIFGTSAVLASMSRSNSRGSATTATTRMRTPTVKTFQEANEEEQEYLLSDQTAFLGSVHAQLDVIMADMGMPSSHPHRQRSLSGTSDDEVAALTSPATTTGFLQQRFGVDHDTDEEEGDEILWDAISGGPPLPASSPSSSSDGNRSASTSRGVSPALSVVSISSSHQRGLPSSIPIQEPNEASSPDDERVNKDEDDNCEQPLSPSESALAGPQQYQEIIREREKLFECLTWLKQRQAQAIDHLHEVQIASQKRILAAAQAAREDCEATFRHLLVNDQVVTDMATDALEEVQFELKSLQEKEKQRIIDGHNEGIQEIQRCLDLLIQKKQEMKQLHDGELSFIYRLPVTLAGRDVESILMNDELVQWREYPQIYGRSSASYDGDSQYYPAVEVEGGEQPPMSKDGEFDETSQYNPQFHRYPSSMMNNSENQYGSDADGDDVDDDQTAVYSLNTMILRQRERENCRRLTSHEDIRVVSVQRNDNDNDDWDSESQMTKDSRRLNDKFDKLLARWK